MSRTGLLIAALALSGCTLDFDELAEETNGSDATLTPPDGGLMVDMDLTPDGGLIPDEGPIVEADLGPTPDMMLTDTDGDGIDDPDDNCPNVANPEQANADGDELGDLCDPDRDGDGLENALDNCPDVANPGQSDLNRDGLGDECDPDADGDGVLSEQEALQGLDPLRPDSDGDGLLDGADSCPLAPDRTGLDTDGDGYGDACDVDDDADGVPDWRDNCPGTPNADQALPEVEEGDPPPLRGVVCADDADGDGVLDEADNCPYHPNADQAISPCEPRFRPQTYGRSVYDLYTSGSSVYAGTAGGELKVAGDEVTFKTNGDGLAGNKVRSVSRDTDGRRWLATDDGVTVIRPDGFTFSMRASDPGGSFEGKPASVTVDLESDRVWVGTDAGLWRLESSAWAQTGDLLSVSDVWLDGEGTLWVSDQGSVSRVSTPENVESLFGLVPLVSPFNRVVRDAADYIWVLANNGAGRLEENDQINAGYQYVGFEARDLTDAPRGSRYLATEAGVRRIDAEGRLFPAGVRNLPDADIRALDTDPEGLRWAGTSRGLVALDGHFSLFPSGESGLNNPCVKVSRRVDRLLWVGSDDGLYTIPRTGVASSVDPESLPGTNIYSIQRVGDEVWVGTNGGVARFDLDAIYLGSLRAEDGIPGGSISAIEPGAEGQVWVGSTESGLARGDLQEDGSWTWSLYTTEDQERLPSDTIRGLAWHGETGALWVATNVGLGLYLTEFGWEPPVPNLAGIDLNDVVVDDDGNPYAGTTASPNAADGLGVYARTPIDPEGGGGNWILLRRGNQVWVNTGTDDVQSLAHDGRYLWVMLAAGSNPRGGWLVRIPTPIENGNLPEGVLYDTLNADLPAVVGTSAQYAEGELHLAYCGDDVRPGGLTVVDGGGLIQRDVSSYQGLPNAGDGVSLTVDHTGAALFVSRTDEGILAWTLSDEAPYRTPYELDRNSVRNALPVGCSLPPGGQFLWCVLQGRGVGRLDPISNQWTVFLSNNEVRAVYPQSDTVAWAATSEGVRRIEAGGGIPPVFNQASTGGGLPSDDVRDIAVLDGKVFAATAYGVGVFTPQGEEGEGTWAAVGRAEGLDRLDVRNLAIMLDGSLWIGTTDGLYLLIPGLPVEDFTLADGLPDNNIMSLTRGPQGTVLIGTRSGLTIGAPSGGLWDFQTYGFVDGLPGHVAETVVVDRDNNIWVRSADGVARFNR